MAKGPCCSDSRADRDNAGAAKGYGPSLGWSCRCKSHNHHQPACFLPFSELLSKPSFRMPAPLSLLMKQKWILPECLLSTSCCPHALWLGNCTGNPGVFQSNPYPYLWKPVPVCTGLGFVFKFVYTYINLYKVIIILKFIMYYLI